MLVSLTNLGMPSSENLRESDNGDLSEETWIHAGLVGVILYKNIVDDCGKRRLKKQTQAIVTHAFSGTS